MNIYTEDEALIELLEVGCTNDKRYKRLPKDVILEVEAIAWK